MNHANMIWINNHMPILIGWSLISIMLLVLGVIIYKNEKRSSVGNAWYGVIPMILAASMIINGIVIISMPTNIERIKGPVQEKISTDKYFKIFVKNKEYRVDRVDWLSVEKGDMVEVNAYIKAKQNYKTDINKINHK